MTTIPSPQGALAGIKVLDLSRVLAGPWCTQMLADLGADVVKVERPGVGDDTRQWGPPFLKDAEGNDTNQASYFTACNRNKRSVTIDMATQEGQRLIRQMALQADIVVENFKVGGLKQYGLDHASLRALNPRLIYCSVTGFGQDGPYAERAGYDLMVQAMTGMMSITGRADSEPGGGPLRVGVAGIDLFTGIYASNAILAAPHGQQPPEPGALPGLPHTGRQHAAGHRQRRTVPALLRGGRPAPVGGRPSLCHQHAAREAPHRPHPRHASRVPHAHHSRVDRAARRQGRSLWPCQHHCPGV